jgi:hypothetical protein
MPLDRTRALRRAARPAGIGRTTVITRGGAGIGRCSDPAAPVSPISSERPSYRARPRPSLRAVKIGSSAVLSPSWNCTAPQDAGSSWPAKFQPPCRCHCGSSPKPSPPSPSPSPRSSHPTCSSASTQLRERPWRGSSDPRLKLDRDLLARCRWASLTPSFGKAAEAARRSSGRNRRPRRGPAGGLCASSAAPYEGYARCCWHVAGVQRHPSTRAASIYLHTTTLDRDGPSRRPWIACYLPRRGHVTGTLGVLTRNERGPAPGETASEPAFAGSG